MYLAGIKYKKKMRLRILLSIAVVAGLMLFSCSKDNNSTVVIRDKAEQYATDIAAIDEFIDTHYMEVDPLTYDVDFVEIPENGTQLSIREQTQYPLKDTLITQDDVDYKVYFLKFREGTQKRPTQVDSVHVAYKGINLNLSVFDEAPVANWFTLETVITGWAHMIPNFKSGTYTAVPGQPLHYDNYGAGVIFLPSGLGYFNGSSTNISPYSPLIFSFKLIEVQYKDHDRDKIFSKDERNFPLTNWSNNPKDFDSDGDGKANYLDVDDDGDGFLTRNELLYTVSGTNYYYPFNGAVSDDPSTPNVDERRGIPRKYTGPVVSGVATPVQEDFTANPRLRRHIDPTATPVNP